MTQKKTATLAELRKRLARGDRLTRDEQAIFDDVASTVNSALQSVITIFQQAVGNLKISDLKDAYQREMSREGGRASWRERSMRYDGWSEAPRLLERDSIVDRAKKLLSGGTKPHNLSSKLCGERLGSARRIRDVLQGAGLVKRKKRT